MENLTPSLWYHVYLDNPTQAKPCVDVQTLAESLPHGSGIDHDWTIVVKRNGDITCHSSYHVMDESGMYNGWHNFRFSIRTARKLESNPLKGPCEGKTQIIARPGDIRMVSWVGGADAADYLYETCEYAISGLLTHRNETVNNSELTEL